MSNERFTEMELECLAKVLTKICEEAGLNAEDIFAEAAHEVASNFGDKEQADELRSRLCLTA